MKFCYAKHEKEITKVNKKYESCHGKVTMGVGLVDCGDAVECEVEVNYGWKKFGDFRIGLRSYCGLILIIGWKHFFFLEWKDMNLQIVVKINYYNKLIVLSI